MTNTILNNAIIDVLTNQFKKDVPKAHSMVENAGYSIYKTNGHFVIHNPKTSRRISVTVSHTYPYSYYVETGYYNVHCKRCKTMADVKKIDFVNCLATPINTVYYADTVSPIKKKYNAKRNALCHARWSSKYYSDRMEGLRKEIAKLTNELIGCSQEKGKADAELFAIRKELGLV